MTVIERLDANAGDLRDRMDGFMLHAIIMALSLMIVQFSSLFCSLVAPELNHSFFF